MESALLGPPRVLGRGPHAHVVEALAQSSEPFAARVGLQGSSGRLPHIIPPPISGSGRSAAPTRIVLLTTLAPAGPPSGGVYVTLATSRAPAGSGGGGQTA